MIKSINYKLIVVVAGLFFSLLLFGAARLDVSAEGNEETIREIVDANRDVYEKTLTDEDYANRYFNVDKYMEHYTDIVAVYGEDRAKALQHYLTFGVYEGRSSMADFDLAAFVAAYPDIIADGMFDLKTMALVKKTSGVIDDKKPEEVITDESINEDTAIEEDVNEEITITRSMIAEADKNKILEAEKSWEASMTADMELPVEVE